MKNTDSALSQRNKRYAPQVERYRVERAIAELLRIAGQVGVSGTDLIQMLNSGASVAEILEILGEKSTGRVQ